MSLPLFPTLRPKLTETGWFNVDKPCDDESEVLALEQEHQNWLNSISKRHNGVIPIGATEMVEEEDDEDDEDDNDDDESESHDEEDEDEMEMDESQDRNSPTVEISIGMPQNHGVR